MNWTVWVRTGHKTHQSQENQWVIRWKGKQISHKLVIGECVQISKPDCKHYLVGVSQQNDILNLFYQYFINVMLFRVKQDFQQKTVKQIILFGDITQKEKAF